MACVYGKQFSDDLGDLSGMRKFDMDKILRNIITPIESPTDDLILRKRRDLVSSRIKSAKSVINKIKQNNYGDAKSEYDESKIIAKPINKESRLKIINMANKMGWEVDFS